MKKISLFLLLVPILIGCYQPFSSSEPSDNEIPADLVKTQIDKERGYYPTEKWEKLTPSELALNETILNELVEELSHQEIYSMLLIKDGYVAKEYYKSVIFERNRTPINSITKSIISSLIGIAIEQGYINGVEQKVSDFIPELLDTSDASKQEWTIEHLLTMTLGLDWDEMASWNEVMVPLEAADDWIDYIINRPLEAEPGEEFNYNTGASHLLSVIIERATGKSTKQFADEYLFSPLGIGPMDYFWDTDPQGYYTGGYKMEMVPSDLAKFGFLFLNGGEWAGEQLLPKEWVEASSSFHNNTSVYGFGDYGYHWWVDYLVLESGETIHSYYASGAFGQKLIIIPHYDFLAVFTSNIPNESYGTYFEQITNQFLLELF